MLSVLYVFVCVYEKRERNIKKSVAQSKCKDGRWEWDENLTNAP